MTDTPEPAPQPVRLSAERLTEIRNSALFKVGQELVNHIAAMEANPCCSPKYCEGACTCPICDSDAWIELNAENEDQISKLSEELAAAKSAQPAPELLREDELRKLKWHSKGVPATDELVELLVDRLREARALVVELREALKCSTLEQKIKSLEKQLRESLERSAGVGSHKLDTSKLAPNPDWEQFCNICCTHHLLPKCQPTGGEK